MRKMFNGTVLAFALCCGFGLAAASCADQPPDEDPADPAAGTILPGMGQGEIDMPGDGDDGLLEQARCRPGFSSCSGKCVNKKTDRNNCGKCGHRCGSGQSCRSGACVRPSPDAGIRFG
jgi:hypothetical protein